MRRVTRDEAIDDALNSKIPETSDQSPMPDHTFTLEARLTRIEEKLDHVLYILQGAS